MYDAPIPRDLALELVLVAALHDEAERLVPGHDETPPPSEEERGRLPRQGVRAA